MLRRYATSAPVADLANMAISSPNSNVLVPDISRSERLVDLFVKNVPIQIDAIERSLSLGVAADVRTHAHKTKGSCLAFGAPSMASTSERLQRLAETDGLAQAAEFVELLRQQYGQVLDELRKMGTRS
jgi:HPt (histidine-containing phosphotransfer) domain-containing protein